ncbi:m7GpppX diphosphatase [Paragonimus westermani]|uniref:m7GpppX diphosphatase n=1 Tax=Paragonimus westermani TaxID=34504 RepID=A0A5J4N6Z3_9TREM|nr:m7GpppX diphosphatase [Paragonimus westermani]
MAETSEPVSTNPITPQLQDTPPVPPKKRRLTDDVDSSTDNASKHVCFCPERMHLVSVLRSDLRSNSIVLHVRFDDTPGKESIVILKKSSFPNDPLTLQARKVVKTIISADQARDNCDASVDSKDVFPCWKANSISDNDVYHRIVVTAGLELVNHIDMTVIHPAEPHHFKRFTGSGSRVIQETPQLYHTVIVPFLAEKPRDLTWVENILNGTAERDRVLFTDEDPSNGFTLVLDYRWSGERIQELHCLGIVRDLRLTCLRDLRARHIPMLERILSDGRRLLAAKYNTDQPPGIVSEDQILAYLHYPPTFYRLHVHFVHINTGDSGTGAARAHLLEEVIRNLQLDSDYYAKRVITIYLHDNSPMLDALKRSSSCSSLPTNGERNSEEC